MQKSQSIITNFIFNFIKTLSTILFPILTFTYSSRILGAEGIGKVNFAKSVISYFSMFAAMGEKLPRSGIIRKASLNLCMRCC